MPEEVRVVLMIGDIYDDLFQLPKPFGKMVDIFRYHSDGRDVRFDLKVSDEILVKITGLSINPYTDYIQVEIDKARCLNRYAKDTKIYCQAVRSTINGPNSPIGRFSSISPNLAVLGQTPLFEEVARKLAIGKKAFFEPIIARFSYFYPYASSHTGFSAKAIGYNLDVPKNLINLKMLLSSEPFLKSVLKKEKVLFENAISALNFQKEFSGQPVIIL